MVAYLLLLVALVISPLASAGTIPSRAEVRAVIGTATYATNGGPAKPLREGMILRSGSTIRTGSNSTVDVFLGVSAGVIRLAENSTVSFDKLTLTQTGADTAVEVQLHLPDGEMYFNVNKLSKASRYEIKMPNGVAGIRGTKGCFSSRQLGNVKPPIVVLTGTVTFAHVGPDGAVNVHTLNAPPATYFSADGVVKQAPPELVDSVTKEVEAVVNGSTVVPVPPQTKQIEPFISPNH